MPNFLWTAKDSNGRPIVREISADTIEQSKAVLLAEGCTDLVLRGDEINDAAERSFGDGPEVFGEEVTVTAEEKLKFRNKPPPTFARAVFDSFTDDKWFTLCLVGLVGWLCYRHRYIYAAAIVAVAVVWTLFRVWLTLPGIYYRKIIEAREWHRWNEVEALVERCLKLGRFNSIMIPATELANSRAKALAGKGRLAEGIAHLQQFENDNGMSGWLFKANVAALYDIVKQPDHAIALTEQAAAEKPTPALYLDLAHRYLKDKRDVTKGRAAMAEAEKETMTDIAKPWHLRCRGMVAYLESDYSTARREFEEALAIWKSTPHQPFIHANLSITRAWLCCTLARQGEVKAATEYFSDAEEFLTAVDETDLLSECKRLLGRV